MSKKSFGTQNILNDLTYNFKFNTIYALMGANGSGKTTLYNIINGFLPLDGGKLLF
ncbi:MAG: ATP-binding cassette domain-containing protein [Campylobacterales bacterium]|nr:ATP-binding cassette domain-containing protein [Campylobacterales bacterium]